MNTVFLKVQVYRQATTKPLLVCNPRTDMALFMGRETRGGMQWILALSGLSFLFLAMVCSASTPPVQPGLLFEISNTSTNQNASFTFSSIWNGYVSYNIPPEQIIVHVFNLPDGSPLGAFSLPRLDDKCSSEDTCMYRTSVAVEEFPTGTFMLIATDPLSGATSRLVISIPLQSKGNIGFFTQGEYDQMFFLASAMLGLFLLLLLAVLVRENT